MTFLEPNNFGGLFCAALFIVVLVSLINKPMKTVQWLLALCLLAAFPYGFWCLYSWNGLIAYNAMMNTVLILFALAHSK